MPRPHRHIPDLEGEPAVRSMLNECLSKKPYKRYQDAERMRKRAQKDRGRPLRIYTCPHCGNYHLTKQVAA